MFQAIPRTPLRDRPRVTHRGQIIQQKKTNTSYQINSEVISQVFDLLKYNYSWYSKYNIHNPNDLSSSSSSSFPNKIEPILSINNENPFPSIDIPPLDHLLDSPTVTTSSISSSNTIRSSVIYIEGQPENNNSRLIPLILTVLSFYHEQSKTLLIRCFMSAVTQVDNASNIPITPPIGPDILEISSTNAVLFWSSFFKFMKPSDQLHYILQSYIYYYPYSDDDSFDFSNFDNSSFVFPNNLKIKNLFGNSVISNIQKLTGYTDNNQSVQWITQNTNYTIATLTNDFSFQL